ncbi:MAG TPA: outer envelope protein [Limnohabitans sp.]|jgi:nucleoside-specific outer membrane channel protein Tsx|uniref:outer envelope protein n=1 Tax=Limnohabitans sp. TaxID=1907725 RepID=UPI0026ACAFA6|nr:outer envelope protein [Limnohabitans sp.]HQR86256.1 outer envelope protein [Limnohabitans sp.]HQS25827.1 outer envelope protein [Limnohabitans sp.]
MKKNIALVLLAAMAAGAQAADWSDTSINYRHGNKYAEPFNANDISKNIIGLNHASGYKYGSNFFNADLLMSDSKDPAFKNSQNGAREVYVVYRNTVDLQKATGKSFKTTGVRGLGVTAGFDFNTKTDAGYNSKKQMLVFGPTVMLDVPAGFLNVSLLQLWESNAPYSTFTNTGKPRYSYDPHPMLTAAWAIPFSVGSVPLEFAGYANYITAKGINESGAKTAAETNIDMQVMYDISNAIGAKPKTFKVGAEYQYWKNKFGNDHTGAAGKGAFAKTPMVRAEYHF